LAYFGKNLTAQQAAKLFEGDPPVPGSELSPGTNDKEVKFNGQDYRITDIAGIIAAQKAKIAADAAAAAQAEALNKTKTEAETEIKATQKETGKPEITDAELNQHLKDSEQVLNDSLKT
jgi:hypothetical protein